MLFATNCPLKRMCYNFVMNNNFDFIAIGDIVVDAFINLKSARVREENAATHPQRDPGSPRTKPLLHSCTGSPLRDR